MVYYGQDPGLRLSPANIKRARHAPNAEECVLHRIFRVACSSCYTVGKGIGRFPKPVVQFGEGFMVPLGDSLNQRFIAWVIYSHTAKSRNRINQADKLRVLYQHPKAALTWSADNWLCRNAMPQHAPLTWPTRPVSPCAEKRSPVCRRYLLVCDSEGYGSWPYR